MTTTHYLDGFQYIDDKLEFFPTAEGYVKATHTSSGGLGGGTTSYNYVFNYTDHPRLREEGNIRLRYALNEDNWMVILEEDHYYPFGLKHKGYNAENYVFISFGGGPVQLIPTNPDALETYKYKYNSQEWQDEFGLNSYDYGARLYMPDIGRWGVIDMKAQAYYPISPYQYVLNNPVVNIDFQGQWTVSRHYSMTYAALAAAGIGKQQADLIAHYSSVYADNPGEHLKWNNRAHPTNKHYYRNDIDYSGTANSQITDYRGKGYNYNIWHSMRSGWEKENNKISASGAKERGLQFGWGKIFESAQSGKLNDLKKNSEGIQAFGQGIHALQDAYAHNGRHDVGASHLWNDRYGDTSEAESISQTAVNVHNLLTENWDALDNSGIKLTNMEGISQEQFSQIMSQVLKYLSQKDEESSK